MQWEIWKVIKRSLVRKLPSHGRWSWLAYTTSYIISTTSTCQSHHQVVAKCNSSGASEFTGGKTLGRKSRCFFSGNVAPGVAEVSAGAGLTTSTIQCLCIAKLSYRPLISFFSKLQHQHGLGTIWQFTTDALCLRDLYYFGGTNLARLSAGTNQGFVGLTFGGCWLPFPRGREVL